MKTEANPARQQWYPRRHAWLRRLACQVHLQQQLTPPTSPPAAECAPEEGQEAPLWGSTGATVLQAQATSVAEKWVARFLNSSFDLREVNGIWGKYFLKKGYKSFGHTGQCAPAQDARITLPQIADRESLISISSAIYILENPLLHCSWPFCNVY